MADTTEAEDWIDDCAIIDDGAIVDEATVEDPRAEVLEVESLELTGEVDDGIAVEERETVLEILFDCEVEVVELEVEVLDETTASVVIDTTELADTVVDDDNSAVLFKSVADEGKVELVETDELAVADEVLVLTTAAVDDDKSAEGDEIDELNNNTLDEATLVEDELPGKVEAIVDTK